MHYLKIEDFEPSGFFHLRTPLFPTEMLDAFNRGLLLPEAIAAGANETTLREAYRTDTQTLITRLLQWMNDPRIREAVFLASPSLEDDLANFRRDPHGKVGRRVMQSLVKYLLRMMTRCTPFGLFAGTSVGTIEAKRCLELGAIETYRRQTRLDMGFLSELTAQLNQREDIRARVFFRPNSSLYRLGDQFRYAEARSTQRQLNYYLVGAEADPYLEACLKRARTGATRTQLAEGLVADDPEIELEEALAYIDQLIDAQLLVSELAPPITGPDATDQLIADLSKLQGASDEHRILQRVQQTLKQIDSQGIGVEPRTYRELAQQTEELPADNDIARLFQVDMAKPSPNLALDQPSLQSIEDGLSALYSLFGHLATDDLSYFKDRFEVLYSDREVPLARALDDDAGVGVVRSNDLSGDVSPLLAGIHFPSKPDHGDHSAVGLWLQRKLWDVQRAGGNELVIEEEDLARFAGERRKPLPDAVACMVNLIDDERLLLKSVSGPSGARLLGRFCGADKALSDHVKAHLAAEEKLREAIYAEIVHHPDGRVGNVLARPCLRQFELVYLGRSGIDEAHRIGIDDLFVSVRYGRVVLRSKRLDKEIIPRLTTAHNTSHQATAIYRFLAMLQHQGVCAGLAWRWGSLGNLPELPRVRYKNCFLAPAQWRLDKQDIETLTQKDGYAAFDVVRRWREQRLLPNRVALVEGDNLLTVLFDNCFSVAAFLHRLKRMDRAILREVLETGAQVTGPEGHFHHQIAIPLVRRENSAQPIISLPERDTTTRRRFLPGSEWLFLKIFCGKAGADRLLVDVIAPLVQHLRSEGKIDRWFFMRYGDPSFHLRLRLHGEAHVLVAELPALQQQLDAAIERGMAWKVELDTYERELHRYGGPAGIDLCEEAFCADSDACLQLLCMLAGEEAWELRWRLALLGKHLLFDDMGYSFEERLDLMSRSASGFIQEYNMQEQGPWPIRDQFRNHRALVEETLEPSEDDDSGLRQLRAVFTYRSTRLKPLMDQLRQLESEGKLSGRMDGLMWSMLHMHANRLLRAAPRPHELVLHTYLERYYHSALAKRRKRKKPR